MSITLLFWFLLLLCCGFASLAGGTSGRIGAALLVAASVATSVFNQNAAWSQTNLPILVVDALLLVGLYLLALGSKAFWPLWVAGFHLVTVLTHVATSILPGFRHDIYFGFSGLWALFGLIAMVVGISLDRQSEFRTRLGHDGG